MKFYNLKLCALFIVSFLSSCSTEQKVNLKSEVQSDFVELPNDLTAIPDSLFKPLDNWLSDYKIIGFGEGDHGFNESLDFRNSYIKYLVKKNEIRILAFESGLLESKMVNDYINGLDLNLDSVLANGMSFTFGQFDQSRELLTWLREENKTRSSEKRIQFYGFDMAGNASNPWLENSSYALEECLDYLESVDLETCQKYRDEIECYLPFLSTIDNAESKEISFLDLPQEKKEPLLKIHNELISTLKKNKETYIKLKGKSAYDWGLQAAKCAKQNLVFLEGYNASPRDQSVREKYMLENLKWIMNREKNEKIFLFAHLTHLAKDIAVIDPIEHKTYPKKRFGEYIQEEFGNEYKLVAHAYCYSDFYTEVDSVSSQAFPNHLNERYEQETFFLNLNEDDALFNRPQIFGPPTLSGDVWITPNKGMDVIFYTEKQHFFWKE
ncbi:MAG: erythromycin esterase-like protein [Crocinitomicaceae bacterium]|jgi:erythromycin esterase-like protein